MIKNKSSKGFTLIELLIVIALLGALAVGLIAAIDPFEQLKKGTDTGMRNTATEFHQAVIRYYAIKNQMPWCKDNSSEDSGRLDCNTNDSVEAKNLTEDPMPDAIDAIIQTGELKSSFKNLETAKLQKIYVTGENEPPRIVVCFQPISKAFLNDPNTKYDNKGCTPSDITCPGSTGCYWCIGDVGTMCD